MSENLRKITMFLFTVLFLLVSITICLASSKNMTYGVTPGVALSLFIDNEKVEISNINFTEAIEQYLKKIEALGERGKMIPRCSEVRGLVEECGLLEETEYNPHLSFLEGDISYWCEQNLSIKRLLLQFISRKLILDAADESEVIIADQGKLSWAAQSIMADFLKEMKKVKKSK